LTRTGQERRCSPQELVVRERLDVLAVHPVEFVDVENRPDRTEPLDVEVGHDVVEREDLAPVRHAPALQGQEVDQRFGQEALLSKPQ